MAAALSGRVKGNIVAVVSGGNIDLATFAALTAPQVTSTGSHKSQLFVT